MRKKCKGLVQKNKELKSELNDIEHEHEYDKENLLSQIREVNKEFDF